MYYLNIPVQSSTPRGLQGVVTVLRSHSDVLTGADQISVSQTSSHSSSSSTDILSALLLYCTV